MNTYLQAQTSGNNWAPGITSLKPNHTALGQAHFADLERQMAEFQANSEALLAEIRKHFMLPRDASVLAFLTEHKNLPEILAAAVPQLKECFGATAIFSLSASIDEFGSQTLYASVIWPGELCEVRAALQRFDDNWWLSRARQGGGYLSFSYELV